MFLKVFGGFFFLYYLCTQISMEFYKLKNTI